MANAIVKPIWPCPVTPAADEAIWKLCANAAPVIMPKTAIIESEFPPPASTSCLNGQPPSNVEPSPTSAMPKKFQSPSVCAIG